MGRSSNKLDRSRQPLSLCLVTGIFPPDVGGPASYVPRIADALIEKGWNVRVICLADSPEEPYPPLAYPVLRIRRSLPKLWRALKVFFAVYQAARQSSLIYVHGLFLESCFAGRLTGVSVICKVVGDEAWERARNRHWFDQTLDAYQTARKGIRARFLDFLRTTPLRFAKRIIVPSSYLRNIVLGWGISSDRIEVIYNASSGAPLLRPFSIPSFPGKTVITVCRLAPWKGVEGLIGAIASIPDTRLVIAGDGEMKAKLLEAAHELQCGDRVIFLGNIRAEDVQGLLRTGDVFALNSAYEGLPHVVLEAMAAEIPVIATDVGGTREVVEHGLNGLLVRSGDATQLKDAITFLLNDGDLARRLTQNAKQTIASKFSDKAMLTQTERLLRQQRQSSEEALGTLRAGEVAS